MFFVKPLLGQVNTLIIQLPKGLDGAVQISGMALRNDSVFMPLEKCGQLFRGKLSGNSVSGELISLDHKRQTEGVSYYNDFFYFSDDARSTIYQYNAAFQLTARLPIRLVNHEGINGTRGFEGIAVVNDSIFLLLLEKKARAQVSVLYKGILKSGEISIAKKKYIPLEQGTRYCDLYYRNGRLYLLWSMDYPEDRKTNQYEIRYLDLDHDLNFLKADTLHPELYLSLTLPVRDKYHDFDTNIEGITMDAEGNFYIISDNCQCECEGVAEKKTLFMKFMK